MIDNKLLERLEKVCIQDDIQKVVVGAIIQSAVSEKTELLLLERVADDFMGGLVELPSGGVDSGEDLVVALKREVREETGLVVESIERYVGSFDYTSGSGKKARQFNFVVTVQEEEVQLNPQEHQRYYWVDPASAQFSRLNISDKTRNVILTASS